MAISVSAINGFGIDGNLVAGLNGDEMVYNPSIDGRIQWNDYFSSSLGIGLLNSGVKDIWSNETETSSTFTTYRLSSNSTTPTLHLSLRGQVFLFETHGFPFYLYAEPKITFVTSSSRKLNLNELSYEKGTNPQTGENTYTLTGEPVYNYITSPNHQDFYGSLSGGISVELKDNVELALGYGYTNIDVFKYVRDKSINGSALQNHLPGAGFQLISIGIRVNYSVE
jgi:hypothetical protein